MDRRPLCALVALGALLAAATASAQEPIPAATYPSSVSSTPFYTPATNLFYNYYAQPGHPAAMYPAPLPAPPLVGHTYYTYQPAMPHEFLYPHRRTYTRPDGCGGYVRTEISWSHRNHCCDGHSCRYPRAAVQCNGCNCCP